jgi:kinesin family protein 2/24
LGTTADTVCRIEKGSIHIPWRSSKLTQLLKHVCETQGERACKTLVVACVAPSIVDSAHSKNTMRYAEMLKVPIPKAKRQKDMKNPSGWTNEQTKQWVSGNVGHALHSYFERAD